jgi:hypothetical protein
VGHAPWGGGGHWSSGGVQVDCMRDIFVLNEICVQGKMYCLIDTWLKYFTYRLILVLALNYKWHILLPAEVRKVCYSLDELFVRYVYLNSFGWRGHNVYGTF